MKHPHAFRRNLWTVIFFFLIAGTIAYGCTKIQEPHSREVPPADLSRKDTVYKYQGWEKGNKN